MGKQREWNKKDAFHFTLLTKIGLGKWRLLKTGRRELLVVCFIGNPTKRPLVTNPKLNTNLEITIFEQDKRDQSGPGRIPILKSRMEPLALNRIIAYNKWKELMQN